MLFLSLIYYIYCVGLSAVGVYNKQYALCTNDTSVRCVQDNANTMEILSNKNKINALFIVIS